MTVSREALPGVDAVATIPGPTPTVIGDRRPDGAGRLLERWQAGALAVTPLADALTCAAVAWGWGSRPASVVVLTVVLVAGTALARGYGDRLTTTAGGGQYLRPSTVGGLAAAVTALVIGPVAGAGVAACAWLCIVVTRLLLWVAVASRRRRGQLLRPAIVVGQPDAVRGVASRLAAFTECGLVAAALLDVTDARERKQACQMLSSGAIRDVVVANGVPTAELVDLLDAARGHRTHFTAALSQPAVVGARLGGLVGDLPLVALGRTAPSPAEVILKRAFDVVGAAALLLVTGPVLALAAAAVRWHDNGPAIYRQARVGLDGRTFTILKLRTMVLDADRIDVTAFGQPPTDGLLFKLPCDPRVTAVGALLRKFAIDELPQLWNVLRGEMSLVGPRPLAVEPHAFDPRAARRHAVRPGITGPWQVSGGNALAFADMVDLDIAYAATWSLRRDVHVLLRTVTTVAIRRAPY